MSATNLETDQYNKIVVMLMCAYKERKKEIVQNRPAPPTGDSSSTIRVRPWLATRGRCLPAVGRGLGSQPGCLAVAPQSPTRGAVEDWGVSVSIWGLWGKGLAP